VRHKGSPQPVALCSAARGNQADYEAVYLLLVTEQSPQAVLPFLYPPFTSLPFSFLNFPFIDFPFFFVSSF